MEMPAPISMANGPTDRAEVGWREWGKAPGFSRSVETLDGVGDKPPLVLRNRRKPTEGTAVAVSSSSVSSGSDLLSEVADTGPQAQGAKVAGPPITRRNSNRPDTGTAQT